jgi:hypothetical protein
LADQDAARLAARKKLIADNAGDIATLNAATPALKSKLDNATAAAEAARKALDAAIDACRLACGSLFAAQQAADFAIAKRLAELLRGLPADSAALLVGWVSEIETHGTPFEVRWKVFKERIAAMKAIWTNERAEYHGDFVNFDPIFCPPKPVQKPHPPLLLGVQNPVNRHIDYLDGWFPPRMPLEQFLGLRKKLVQRAEAKGRDPRSILITVHQNFPDKFATETAAINAYREAGVERIIYRLTGLPVESIMPRLDELARMVE